MSKHIMLDLETMGIGNDAAIVTIGAVAFDKEKIHEEFYNVVNLNSSVVEGGKIDVSTVLWWLQQSDAARAELTKDTMHFDIADALWGFNSFAKGATGVWGNGATFDNVVIRSAMARIDIKPSWSFRADKCYRTVKGIYPELPAIPQTGTAHHALDDAKWQAEYLMRLAQTHNFEL